MEEIIQDERGGRPSASGMERLALCPGSWAAERGLPETTSEWAAEGTLLHSVLAGEITDEGLTDDQRWVVDRCRSIEANIIEAVAIDCTYVEREVRLAVSDGEGVVFSGKPDVVYTDGNGRALVLDYKTGRGAVPPAERNYQMRALAVLVAEKHGADDVFVALVHPRYSNDEGEVFTLARYGHGDIVLADDELLGIVSNASAVNAPRVPGESQCRYCKAKAQCPEATGQAIAIVPPSITVGMKPKDVALALPLIPADELADLYDRCKLATMVADAVIDQAKARIEGGEEIPGLELKPGAVERKIDDPQKAFDALGDTLTAESFIACCTVSVPKLQNAIGDALCLKGETSKKAAIQGLLGDVIELKPKAASLARATSTSVKVAA